MVEQTRHECQFIRALPFLLYLPLSNSVAKITIFRQKNIEGAFAPACTPKLRICLHVNLLCLTGRKVSLSA